MLGWRRRRRRRRRRKTSRTSLTNVFKVKDKVKVIETNMII